MGGFDTMLVKESIRSEKLASREAPPGGGATATATDRHRPETGLLEERTRPLPRAVYFMHDAPRHHMNTWEKYGESLKISSQVRVPVRLLYIGTICVGNYSGSR